MSVTASITQARSQVTAIRRIHGARSSLARQLGDDAHALHAAGLQLVHDVHQVLQLHAAISPEEHLLRRAREQRLPHALVEDVHPHRVVTDIDDAVGSIGEWYVDENALL